MRAAVGILAGYVVACGSDGDTERLASSRQLDPGDFTTRIDNAYWPS